MKHADALVIAETLLKEMRPYCHRVEIAGSIRRLKSEVKDIEIVAIPKWESVAAGFFAEDVSSNNSLYCRWAMGHPWITWIKAGTNQIQPWNIKEDGKYWRGLIASSHCPENETKLDLFLTTPEQFGILMVIRTGPESFSKKIVTQSSKGGWLPDHLRVDGGWLMDGDRRIPTPTELSVFDAIGRPWIPPEKRV